MRKEHIRAFAEPEDSIPPSSAQDLLELVSMAEQWDDLDVAGEREREEEERRGGEGRGGY